MLKGLIWTARKAKNIRNEHLKIPEHILLKTSCKRTERYGRKSMSSNFTVFPNGAEEPIKTHRRAYS